MIAEMMSSQKKSLANTHTHFATYAHASSYKSINLHATLTTILDITTIAFVINTQPTYPCITQLFSGFELCRGLNTPTTSHRNMSWPLKTDFTTPTPHSYKLQNPQAAPNTLLKTHTHRSLRWIKQTQFYCIWNVNPQGSILVLLILYLSTLHPLAVLRTNLMLKRKGGEV